MPVLRRFIDVQGRAVHYRRVGSGPQVVLIHGSPASSEVLAGEMQALAPRFTCFAFDTPGFGDSAALTAETVAAAGDWMSAFADALAETLAAIDMPPCAVYGSHTGAAIALQLGCRHAARVTGLVLDGLPLFTEAERSALPEAYFEPLRIDGLGGHFTHTWTRFRDLFLWFPWPDKRPGNLNDADLPTPEQIQRWVTMFYRSGTTYAEPYRAAIGYGPAGLDAVARLECPAVFLAHQADMLFSHLDRLPPLRSDQCIVRATREQRIPQVLAALARFSQPTRGSAATAPAALDGAARPRVTVGERQFIDLPHGQMLVRRTRPGHAASGGALPLLLLHNAPGSSHQLVELLHRLQDLVVAFAPDLPGHGESAQLRAARSAGQSGGEAARTTHSATAPTAAPGPDLTDYVSALLVALDRLELPRVRVYGCGFGASLAAELARSAPKRVAGLLLHGVLQPTPAQRAEWQRRYSPRITLEADGSHWYRTWLMLRDSLVYFPWFDARQGALRRVSADFDAQRLHDWTFEVLKQHASQHELIEAALHHDLDAALSALSRVPGLPGAVLLSDANHPFAGFAAAGAPCPGTRSLALAASSSGSTVAAQLADLLSSPSTWS